MSSLNLNCPICDFSYDPLQRQPKLLPCSHSFCLNCLLSLVGRGNRLCPLCRGYWHGSVEDLPTCYQLISEGDIQGQSRSMEVCVQHNAEKALWCNSCQAVLCQKCVRLLHKECEWMLVSEKCENLIRSHAVAVQKLSEKESYLKKLQRKNEIFLANISNFSLMLPTIQEDVKDYEKKLNTWKEDLDLEIEKSSSVSNDLYSVVKLQEKLQSLERLGKLPAPARPTTLLLHIVDSFQATEDGDPETFLVKFRKSVADLRSPGTATLPVDDFSDEEEDFRQAPELKEKQTWTLTNRSSITTAGTVLTGTSVRPSAVCVQGGSWKGRSLQDFLAVLALVCCDVLLQTGDTLWTPGDSTILTTRERIEALVKPSQRCRLIEFWGHPDVTALKLLPNTVQRVGLALRSARDMTAVNALDGVAFYDKGGSRIWSGLTEIHLSVTQGFQPSDWDLQWKWQYKNGRLWKQGLSLLEAMGISLALHLPRLDLQHLDWMMALLNTITSKCQYIGLVKKLYLPDCKLTPDALLGVLRDLNMKAEVHLPGVLTSEAARKDLSSRYWSYSCTIVWDMPTL